MLYLIISLSLVGQAFVLDGDTISVDDSRIRLWGLDAPEWDSQRGQASRDYLIGLLKNKEVRCDDTGERSYERVVARCFVGHEDLTELMIRAGHGRPYCRFVGDTYNDAAIASGQRPCRAR